MKILQIEREDIDNVQLAPWNYKSETELQLDAFKKSIEKNGFLYGMVVAQKQEDPESDKWEVCDGNHRLMILRELGAREVPVYKLGRLSRKERMRIAVELNHWRFENDESRLLECLKSIWKVNEDVFETLPYSSSKTKEILNMFQHDSDWNNFSFDDIEELQEDDGKKGYQRAIVLLFTDDELAFVEAAIRKYKLKKNNFYLTFEDAFVGALEDYVELRRNRPFR